MADTEGGDSAPKSRASASHVGRSSTPSDNNNAEENPVPDFQYFGLTPRSPPNLQGFLEVWGVELYTRPDDVNKTQHHTQFYDINNLVVRRGQAFQTSITLNRPYNPQKDKLWLELLIGRHPSAVKGTYIRIYLQDELVKGRWGAKVLSNHGNMLSVSVMSPPDCIVGRFRFYVAVLTSHGIRRTARDKATDIYFIFNPWCEEDAVYLSEESQRHEYVLNDDGCIYYGTSTDVISRSWIFGQFERNVLNACIYVLDRARMPLQSRGCPIKVCRVASAMINSKDDGGVLVGSWDGPYVDGVAPTAWNGSVEILLQYFRNGHPVCYGQCWVFAAVLNTVLRCLGLPARVVTNFSSAHDNNANLHMDFILDPDGKKIMELTKDSIWNYHCWNECWMLRDDIPSGYGGWQAVDATPQETSEGMYRCGPVSVNAIKQGQVCFPFDASFVYAEVNSDVVYWTQQNDGTLVKGEVKTDDVGKLILTKSVGSDMRMNITDQYKYPEGSREERASLKMAELYGVAKTEVPTELPKDVSAKVQVDENIMVGSSFQLGLEFSNLSNAIRTVEVQITGYVVFYTGVPKVQVTDENLEVEMEPDEVHQTQVQIKSKDYEDKLVEQFSLEFLITAHVLETGQRLVIEKKVMLQIPKLNITVEGEVAFGREVTVVVQFTNPFTKPLEQLVLRIDGLDYTGSHLTLFSQVTEKETLKANVKWVLRRRGRWKIIASLDCPALRQVGGELELQVQ
ncbi:coagulation factor XIII A chain-like [Rhinoraja longicauda]